MTGDENRILLEVRDRLARIEQKLEDRDEMCRRCQDSMADLDSRVQVLERKSAGQAAWIAAGAAMGSVAGWMGKHFLSR